MPAWILSVVPHDDMIWIAVKSTHKTAAATESAIRTLMKRSKRITLDRIAVMRKDPLTGELYREAPPSGLAGLRCYGG
jgi:hypothetical protein